MRYNQHNVPGPEYRVRPVVRYVVTRYCHPYVHEEEHGAHSVSGGSEVIGEFHKEDNAYAVATSMDRAEKSIRMPTFAELDAYIVEGEAMRARE